MATSVDELLARIKTLQEQLEDEYRRSDYMVFDREDLPYLNLIEKLNCFYCSYGNAVAARTEQYWCPIKHARRIRNAHDRYAQFFEHGDGEAFRQGLERLRRQYKDNGNG